MTDKELKKLKRVQLLRMLLDAQKEIEDLKAQLDEANKKLEDRKINIESLGSIAEASLQLTGVFEAAQNAINQYFENVAINYGTPEGGYKVPEIIIKTPAMEKSEVSEVEEKEELPPKKQKKKKRKLFKRDTKQVKKNHEEIQKE